MPGQAPAIPDTQPTSSPATNRVRHRDVRESTPLGQIPGLKPDRGRVGRWGHVLLSTQTGIGTWIGRLSWQTCCTGQLDRRLRQRRRSSRREEPSPERPFTLAGATMLPGKGSGQGDLTTGGVTSLIRTTSHKTCRAVGPILGSRPNRAASARPGSPRRALSPQTTRAWAASHSFRWTRCRFNVCSHDLRLLRFRLAGRLIQQAAQCVPAPPPRSGCPAPAPGSAGPPVRRRALPRHP